VILLLWLLAAQDTPPDLSTVPADLVTPAMVEGEPAAGARVKQTTPGWEGTTVHHALYLPRDWKAGGRYPVIVEYAGNGGYKNAFGDVSHGTVEGSNLGYGLTAGAGMIWVCLPFVQVFDEHKENAEKWWGDVEETKAYCRKTVALLCDKYGGDPKKVVLAGFSRGAIGCNYIGLHDDEIATLWRGFFLYSQYDGQQTSWGYEGADRASALERLKRLNGRPQWISMERSVDHLRDYVTSTGIEAPFTFQTIPFRNHSDQWVLRDTPVRKAAREWLAKVLAD
jgi:hypothetical protein